MVTDRTIIYINVHGVIHLLRSARINSNSNWIYKAPGEHSRTEAFFSGAAFAPHRHDTYAIGLTLGGVQSFKYRGATRNSEVGRCVVLHPDELHDGQAGTDDGFRYSVAYIDPAKIQSVLGGKALPFIENGISNDPRLFQAICRLLGELDQELGDLEYDDVVYDIAVAMEQVSDQPTASRKSYDYEATELARQYISNNLEQAISLDKLEAVAGRDRWKLSRDFRALYGTSPYRYLVMRRLENARSMLLAGHSPASVAITNSFADQSHMNRHFKKTYGLTPKQWLKTLQMQNPLIKSA